MSESLDAGSRRLDLALILGVVAVALLIQVVPWWGIPLNTDVAPIYLLQVSRVPGLDAAVPYGLRVATAQPMDPWEACIEQYRAFTRFNCVDVWLFRATAWAAGYDADIWRSIYFVLNAAGVGVCLAIARSVGVPRTLAAALGLAVIVGPLEIWNGYVTSEPKATLFVLLAVLLALGPSTVRQSALAAVAMLLATLTKETFATSWVVVLAALLSRRLAETSDRPLLQTLRSAWPLLVPHLVALLAVIAFAVGLRLAYEPRANYAVNVMGPAPPLADFWLGYWSALQPPPLRGLLLPMLAAGVVALALALACSPTSRQGMVRAYARLELWVLIGGLGLGVVLHGLGYLLAKRTIDDTRYLLPGNYLFGLAVALLLAPLAAGLTARWRIVVGLAVSLAGAGTLLWQLGRVHELTTIGLMIAVPVALLLMVVVPVRGLPRRLAVGVYAGTAVLLLTPYVDWSLNLSGVFRVSGDEMAAFHRRVFAEAPPNGHVLVRAAEPYMIEEVWAIEAYTLLHGRLDLAYHLEVEDLSRLVNDNGFVAGLIAGYNTGRRPLPPSGDELLTIRMTRDGMRRGTPRRIGGEAAVQLFLSAPRDFFFNRYIEGRAPALEYEWLPGTR